MKIFDQIKKTELKRTPFDLSHEKKMSFNMGELMPMYVDEVLPGDKFKVKSEIFMKLAPMITPIMHRINVFVHYFFVPNRLLLPTKEWENFIAGNSSEETVLPSFSLRTDYAKFAKGSLPDAMGFPILDAQPTSSQFISKLPFRAYNLIWNEYYRDQNLQDEVDQDNLKILKRAWERDYLTSCLPFAQKGGEAELPLDIEYEPKYKAVTTVTKDGAVFPDSTLETVSGDIIGNSTLGREATIENLEAEQELTSSVSVSEIRLAEKLQRWLEINARAGTRYVEHLLAHWKVRSSDARLNRPEYLGGGKQPIKISEIVSQAEVRDSSDEIITPQGNMSGHGISVGNSNFFQREFEEHGFIIGIVSVIPRTAYSQSLDKMWSRLDKFDYYYPAFAHLGEQEVLNKEVAYMGDQTDNDEVFGYQSRWAEYKYKNSLVTGDYRDELDMWHMSRKFENRPELNEEFIQCVPTHRIFAVEDADSEKLYCQVYNNITAIRPMPYFGTPKL